jgi:hypothetical protein
MDEKKGDWIIGVVVKVKTSLGEEVEGEIFSYDSNTNCVILVEVSWNFVASKDHVLAARTSLDPNFREISEIHCSHVK